MMLRWLGTLAGFGMLVSALAGIYPQDDARVQSPPASAVQVSAQLDPRYKFNEQDHKIFLTWIRNAIKESEVLGHPAIIVDKEDHKLYLIRGTKLILRFPVEIGGYNPFDPKIIIYDGCTPEGPYRVTEVKEGGSTKYHRAFLIDYPNAEDRARYARLKKEGRIPPGRSIGGLVEIHGGGTGFAGNDFGRDWTAGCVALADGYMDQLAAHVRVGTRVVIVRYGTRFPDELAPGLPNLAKWEKLK